MSTDQLRKHLADAHNHQLHGTLPYVRLVAIHEQAHRKPMGHEHDHDNWGDG